MANSEPNAPDSVAARLATAVVARRGVLTALAVLATLGFVAQTVWNGRADALRRDARYVVTPQSLTADAPPPWLRSDPVTEAIGPMLSRGELSVLDPPSQLEGRLVASLAAHPWVRGVREITKQPPNGVTVRIEYREPLAAVRGESGLLPIDREATPLPPGDLPVGLLRRLPRVRAAGLIAPPPAGAVWRDPRVAGAATLVDAFGDAWGQLDLFEVRVDPNPRFRGNRRYAVFELVSTGNTRILWGAAPGFEPDGEPPFAAKLAGLEAFVARNGPLDNVATAPGLLEFDLRGGVSAHRRVVLRDVSDREAGDGAKPLVK